MSKVFMSFLGTNTYLPCNYSLGERKVENCIFVQEGLLRFLAEYSLDEPESRIVIFLTAEAEEKNWKDNNDEEGLNTRIEKLGLSARLIPVRVPAGNSEDEIWKIFRIVYESLGENDEVYFDITHGFRSLPMLGIVLLHYARFLKNIRVNGIYYGAFETLGRLEEVKKMAVEERDAPIFDLTPFHSLQLWSGAAEHFVKEGSTKSISNLLFDELNPILRKTKGGDKEAVHERDFAKGFNSVGELFKTIRGKRIYEGYDYEKLQEQIDLVESEEIRSAPLSPLIKEVKKKIVPYTHNTLENNYHAVGWCIEHGLLQQGITLVQETIVSIILDEIGEEWLGDEDNYRKNKRVENNRSIVSSIIHSHHLQEKGKERDTPKELKENPELVEKLQRSNAFSFFNETYEQLRGHRNDINHGGFIRNIKPGDFEQKLRQAYTQLKEWFEGKENT